MCFEIKNKALRISVRFCFLGELALGCTQSTKLKPMYEIFLAIALLLILIDIFFSNEIPTHVGYIFLSITVTITTTSILLGIGSWLGLIVFHYTIWRKLLEKFHDNILSPYKHIGGIDGLIGKEGVIVEVEGKQFIQIDKELYEFEKGIEHIISIGETYKIAKVNSNKLYIKLI